MIIVITFSELNKETGVKQPIVSHGINTDNDEIVVLPQVPISEIGARFDAILQEFVLY